MRQFVPSDYVDKKGNVYETVGENIREGKNGSVTSDFPTPEELTGGFISSDGKNYTTVLKNLGTVTFKNRYAIADIKTTGVMEWVATNLTINSNTKNSDIPIGTRGVTEYIESKIPNTEANYSWITVDVTYDGTNYSIDNTSFSINNNGVIFSDTKNIIDLFPISTTAVIGKTQTIARGITGYGKFSLGWDIKASYTAKILVEG